MSKMQQSNRACWIKKLWLSGWETWHRPFRALCCVESRGNPVSDNRKLKPSIWRCLDTKPLLSDIYAMTAWKFGCLSVQRAIYRDFSLVSTLYIARCFCIYSVIDGETMLYIRKNSSGSEIDRGRLGFPLKTTLPHPHYMQCIVIHCVVIHCKYMILHYNMCNVSSYNAMYGHSPTHSSEFASGGWRAANRG
jgi:hypothetical protein